MTQKRPLKIVLTGYFMRGNLGDDAMVEGLHSYLEESLPGASMHLAPMPPSTGITALPGYLASINSADWVILAGGTHFHDYYGPKSWRLLSQMGALFTLARLTGTNIAFSGIGIGPLRTLPGRMLTRHLLSLSGSTTVRDSASLHHAEALRPGSAVAGFDLALLAPPPHLSDGARQAQRRLGCSLVAYHAMYGLESSKDERMLDAFAEAIRAQAAAGLIEGVDIFPFSRSGVYSDLPISRQMAERLTGIVDVNIVDCESPAAVREHMVGLNAFVGARFHSIILAYQAGLPVVPIIYHEKCASLVAELGLEDAVALHPASLLDTQKIHRALETLFSNPNQFRARLSREEARGKALSMAEVLVQAIERQKGVDSEGPVSPALSRVRRTP